MRARRTPWLAAACLALALVTSGAPAAAQDPAAASSPAAIEALDRALAGLDAPEEPTRRAALKATGDLGPDAVPAIARKLAELRRAQSAPIVAVVKQARGSLPRDADVADGLVATTPADDAAKTALTTAALLGALAHAGTTDAARALVKVASDHGGAFRPEIARHLKTVGDKALPALVETKKASPDVRRWGTAQLEGMGKRLPGDAVQTKDNDVLADVLTAYGAVRDLDAVPVILSFVNADRARVRDAARAALVAFDKDALWKMREAYQNVANKQAPDTWTPAEIAKELFAAYDRLRLTEVYGLLDAGLKAQREGRLDEAVAAFDRVLARQPTLDRRAETIPAYVAWARQREASDPAVARAAFAKALRLANDGPRAPSIRAELAYLDAEDLRARGIVDRAAYERVLALDPTHAAARAQLARMDAAESERSARVRMGALAAGLFLAFVVALVLFAGRGPRRALRA